MKKEDTIEFVRLFHNLSKSGQGVLMSKLYYDMTYGQKDEF